MMPSSISSHPEVLDGHGEVGVGYYDPVTRPSGAPSAQILPVVILLESRGYIYMSVA